MVLPIRLLRWKTLLFVLLCSLFSVPQVRSGYQLNAQSCFHFHQNSHIGICLCRLLDANVLEKILAYNSLSERDQKAAEKILAEKKRIFSDGALKREKKYLSKKV